MTASTSPLLFKWQRVSSADVCLPLPMVYRYCIHVHNVYIPLPWLNIYISSHRDCISQIVDEYQRGIIRPHSYIQLPPWHDVVPQWTNTIVYFLNVFPKDTTFGKLCDCAYALTTWTSSTPKDGWHTHFWSTVYMAGKEFLLFRLVNL
jgi:hypothetical protein